MFSRFSRLIHRLSHGNINSANMHFLRGLGYICVLIHSSSFVRVFLRTFKYMLFLKYGFCKKYFDRNEPLTS